MRVSFPLLVLLFLVIGVGGGAAFGGGVLYGRGSAPGKATSPVTVVAGGAANVAAGGGPGGAGGTPATGGRGGFGGTNGVVESVTGNALAIRSQQGTVTNVTLAADTRILTTAVATRDDLKPGVTVTVLGGQPGASGSIAATAITITPPGLNAGGGAPAGAATPGSGRGGQGGGGPGARATPTR